MGQCAVKMGEIETIAVLGSGAMGIDLAVLAADHGFDVLLWHRKDRAIAADRLNRRLEKYVEKGILSIEQRDSICGHVKACDQLSDIAEVDLVIETIVEDYDKKAALFKKLEKIVSADCIIGSNTSSFSIASLAEYSGGAGRFAGVHFFNPALKMELVEIVSCPETASGTIETLRGLVRQMGKTSVLVKDSPGFIVNRLMACQIKEAVEMVGENIASSEDVDTAMKLGLGHPIGPLALADLIGLDVMLSIYESLQEGTGTSAFTPPEILKEMVANQQLGRKAGQGFFIYR